MTNENYNQDETIDGLDETLDDLADAPSTALWPNGAHQATLKINRGKKAGSYMVNMTYIGAVELSNPSDQEPAEGDQSTVFIHTKKKDGTANDYGQGQLKKILQPIGAALQTNSISEILEATKSGLEVIVVTKVKASRDEKYDDSQEILSLEMPS